MNRPAPRARVRVLAAAVAVGAAISMVAAPANACVCCFYVVADGARLGQVMSTLQSVGQLISTCGGLVTTGRNIANAAGGRGPIPTTAMFVGPELQPQFGQFLQIGVPGANGATSLLAPSPPPANMTLAAARTWVWQVTTSPGNTIGALGALETRITALRTEAAQHGYAVGLMNSTTPSISTLQNLLDEGNAAQSLRAQHAAVFHAASAVRAELDALTAIEGAMLEIQTTRAIHPMITPAAVATTAAAATP